MYYGYVFIWESQNRTVSILISDSYREITCIIYLWGGLVNQLIYKQIIEHVLKSRNNTIIIEKVIMIFILSWYYQIVFNVIAFCRLGHIVW